MRVETDTASGPSGTQILKNFESAVGHSLYYLEEFENILGLLMLNGFFKKQSFRDLF